MGDFGKLNFSVSFNRTSAFPLEANSYFTNLEQAEAAAKTAVEPGSADSTYYIGLTLTVADGADCNLYIINPDLSLKQLTMLDTPDITWENILNKPTVFNTNIDNISDLHSSWDNILKSLKPTTIGGYGITDAYTKTESDSRFVNTTGDTMTGVLSLNEGLFLPYGKQIDSTWSYLLKTSWKENYGDYFELRITGQTGIYSSLIGTTHSSKELYWNENKIWHEGNDGSGSGLDADTLDSVHLITDGHGTGVKKTFFVNGKGQVPLYIKIGTLRTVEVTGMSSSKVMFTVRGGINFGGANESVHEVAASTRGSIQVTSTLVRGSRELKFGYVSTSSSVEIWAAYDGTYIGTTEIEISASENFTLAMTSTTTKPSGFVEGSYRILAATTDNVASASKLTTSAGSSVNPVYFANGIPIVTSYSFGNSSGNAAISNGILCNNLNSDMIDGFHANNLTRNYVHGAHATYLCLGTITIPQGGYAARIYLISGSGYNGDETQSRVGMIILRTSNGIANGNGKYYAGHVESYRYGAYNIYVVQNSNTSFTLWTDKTNYTGDGYISIDNHSAVSFTPSNQTASSLPSGATMLNKYQVAYTDSNVASATKLLTARQINGTNFDGTYNITTANWGTARNITIGSSTKSVNGGGNVSWSLSEIGAYTKTESDSRYFLDRGIVRELNPNVLTNGVFYTDSVSPVSGVYSFGTLINFRAYPTNVQFYIPDGGDLYFRSGWNSQTQAMGSWRKVWDNANDGSGSGSGLDADLLDGKHYADIVNGNVASATRLLTPRSLWGLSFDGQQNISGNMTGVGSIIANGESKFSNGTYSDPASNIACAMKISQNFAAGSNCYLATLNGNVGIGTTAPGEKLTVAGNISATGALMVISGSIMLKYTPYPNNQNVLSFDWGTYSSDSLLFQIPGNHQSDRRMYLTDSKGLTLNFGAVYAPSGFYEESDINLKTNIKSIDFTNNIELVSFNWKESGKKSYGVIAQLVELYYPELVSTDESTGYKSVNYDAVLIIKCALLENRIKQLEKELEDLKYGKDCN